MRLISRREQIGGNITLGRDIGDDFYFLVNIRQVGEKLGPGITLENVAGNFVSCLKSDFQAVGVGVIQEDLRFQHSRSRLSHCQIIAKGQIEQNPDRGTALHVRQQLKRECWRNFRYHHITGDDLPQEIGLFTCSARGAGYRIVDQHLQRVVPMRIFLILYLQDDLVKQRPVIDWLWCQPLFPAVFNLFEIGVV